MNLTKDWLSDKLLEAFLSVTIFVSLVLFVGFNVPMTLIMSFTIVFPAVMYVACGFDPTFGLYSTYDPKGFSESVHDDREMWKGMFYFSVLFTVLYFVLAVVLT